MNTHLIRDCIALLILPICALVLCYGLYLGLGKFWKGWKEGRRKKRAIRQRKVYLEKL